MALAPTTWPQWLTIADYARACSEVAGSEVSRQSIFKRLDREQLTAMEQTIGGKTRRYIDTTVHPPSAGPGRWPNRPPGSAPRPQRTKA